MTKHKTEEFWFISKISKHSGSCKYLLIPEPVAQYWYLNFGDIVRVKVVGIKRVKEQ